MGRDSDGVISLTFADLEKSNQGHLQKTGFPYAIVTIDFLYGVIGRGSDGIICLTFGDLG